MIYKVSYVVVGTDHPGTIANVETPPQVGDYVVLGKYEFEITEVLELMPPRGDFSFLHATCRLAEDNS